MKTALGRRTQSGYSLSESLIALLLLSSGLLALAQFQGQFQQHGRQTKTQTTAVNLAQQKLEELRDLAGTNYAAIASGRDNPSTDGGSHMRFDRRWTVTPHDSPDYKAVKVTTGWQSSDGVSHAVTLTSFVAPRAPYRGTGTARTGEQDEDEDRDEDEDEAPWDRGFESDRDTRPTPPSTCLCTRIESSGHARLDNRSSDPNCTDACCQGAWDRGPGDSACTRANCNFVARCRAG